LSVRPFTSLTGWAAPLPQTNIDTDVIIRIERLTAGDPATLGRHAFEALRYRPDGAEDPDFVLNRPPWRGAPILVAGANFGCGSSREGAVTALMGMGVSCVIAESFGDIFYANCCQNGLLPVRLVPAQIDALMALAPVGEVTVDLHAQSVTTIDGQAFAFEIDALRREALLEGLDDLGLTLKQMDLVRAWQVADRTARPWAWPATA
jgi:3-isopropylmalate/(R)-2-methylmalate dehydratase small subunit